MHDTQYCFCMFFLLWFLNVLEWEICIMLFEVSRGVRVSQVPELGVAVQTAEAGGVEDLGVSHQPLQRVHRLQACNARLPHGQAELLHTDTLRMYLSYTALCLSVTSLVVRFYRSYRFP